MNRWILLYAIVLIGVFITVSCSGNGGSPITPSAGSGLTSGAESYGINNSSVLWGYYDLYFDLENQTVEAIPNRNLLFTANVTTFVNMNATNLGFVIHGTPVDPGGAFIDVDIDVSISHPFPGLNQYDGWDVRGIFMGSGSANLTYDGDLAYPVAGVDQEFYDYDLSDDPDIGYDDPYDGLVGMPDGYTRWWNPDEFTDQGPLGYTEGVLATPGYAASLTATLNPYKYFCDGLGAEDDLWEWLNTSPNADDHGVFTAGTTNTRNYYLRFPTPDPNVRYGYAIAATWGEAPGEPPPACVENAIEAVTCSVAVTESIYYVDDLDYGGNLILDIDVWGWDMSAVAPEEGIWQPSVVYIESDIIGGSVQLTAPPTAGGDNYSTWHSDIPTTVLTSNDMNEYWVICEYGGPDYSCEYPAAAPDAPLAAFFRYDLYISPIPYCEGPDITDVAPDILYQNNYVNVTATGIGFIDGPMLDAWLSRTGETNIAATTVTFVDDTQVDFLFPISMDTALGNWDFNMTHNDCPTVTTMTNALEVAIPSWDIFVTDTSPFGEEVTPAPDNAGWPVAIDIGCCANDGAFYLAWALNDVADTYGDGYVDRYNAAGDTVLASAHCLPNAGPSASFFKYGRVGLDCGTVSSVNGWSCVVDPAIHYGSDETNTQGDNDSWGFWYGDPLWWAQDSCSSTASGFVYSYANHYLENTRRTWWEHGTAGNWDNYPINYALIDSSNFDGAENQMAFFPLWRTKVMALAAGSTRDDLWNIHMDAPHVNKYTNYTWLSYSGVNFGADGTFNGELAAWTDTDSPDYVRLTGVIDITMYYVNTADRIYTLDEPTNGYFRIQCFDDSGTYIASSGEVAAADFGATTAYRMDYNDFEELIYVLLDNNTIVAFIDDTL